MGAIDAMSASRHLFDVDNIVERAERAARLMAANGFRFVRTHADVTVEHGLRSVEALAEVRRRVADVIDLEIVALCDWPVVGLAGADQRSLLVDALAAGADLVGGCPHLEDRGDTRGATEVFLQIATDHGVGVDLHTDETLDPDVLGLVDLAELVLAGFEHPRDRQPLREPRHADARGDKPRSPTSSRPQGSASSRSPTPTCSSRAGATPRCLEDSPLSPRSARPAWSSRPAPTISRIRSTRSGARARSRPPV